MRSITEIKTGLGTAIGGPDERRHLTALFSDMCRSMELGDPLSEGASRGYHPHAYFASRRAWPITTRNSLMHPRTQQALLAMPVILTIGAAIAWAGSQASIGVAGWPLFALCGAFSFIVNWLIFIPAFAFQTERYFDLSGSLTYLALMVAALLLGLADDRAWLLAGLIGLWAARLGSFLFVRVIADGGDGRMDALKPNFMRFLMTWTLQGLWVFLTASCALAAMTTATAVPLGGFAYLGATLWIIGFACEVVADHQKRVFRRDPTNKGRFITSGLWAWSQHPNYFGEILLWFGIALIALPTLRGAQYATLISPIFVFVLLTRISGIPLLRGRARKRWGEDAGYLAYRARTATLFPRPPKAQS